MPGAIPTNPLAEAFDGPFGLPPFEAIAPEHFLPAFTAALAEHNEEVAAIANSAEEASFENTVVALEKSGGALRRVGSVFWNLASADTNSELQAIEREMAPKLAAHFAAIHANEKLFLRLDAVLSNQDALGFGDEDKRILEIMHRRFVRAGAALAADDKMRYGQIIQRQATLATQFSQNVLADEAAFELPLEGEDDLAGLPDYVRDGAASAAGERNSKAPYVITLSRSLIEPFLTYSERRDLREKAYKAWVARGANGGLQDADNLCWKLKLVIDGCAPASLLDSYDAERVPAADENILNSTRATDFITPKSHISRVFRDAVLDLSELVPFARPLVNSGRLSVPAIYDGSPLNGHDDAAMPRATRPGAPAVDAPLGDGEWLLDRLGDRFQLLAINAGLPERVLVGDMIVEAVEVDANEKVRARYLGDASSAVYLMRPDQHVAARWQAFDAEAVSMAVRQATGRVPGGSSSCHD